MSKVLSSELVSAIRAQYRCDWYGYHGIRHWARVRANTRLFADNGPVEVNGHSIRLWHGASDQIDPLVCDLFAVFHDACRVNEWEDPGHGARGADLAGRFWKKYFQATDNQMDQVTHACRYHTDGLREGTPSVQACWDADRCDLPRVGVNIDVRRLCHPMNTEHPEWLRLLTRTKQEGPHQKSRHT